MSDGAGSGRGGIGRAPGTRQRQWISRTHSSHPSFPHDGETDARRLRRKNTKAFRLAIELSKREASK